MTHSPTTPQSDREHTASPLERQLDRAAGIIVGTLPHMWRPEWQHIRHPHRLTQLLAPIWDGYPAAVSVVSDWWADQHRPGWDTPWHHPDSISHTLGWDITRTEGWHDPHLPWTLLRHVIRQLATRIRWWNLRHHAAAILHQLEHGEPPDPADLKALSV